MAKKEKTLFSLILDIISYIVGMFRRKEQEIEIANELEQQQFNQTVIDLETTYNNNASEHKPTNNFQESLDYLNAANKKIPNKK